MPHLVFDVGNTYTKIALFEGDQLLWVESHAEVKGELMKQMISENKPGLAILSSVKKQVPVWQGLLASAVEVIVFNAGMVKGITNHYKTPQTLGLDRIAAVQGAVKLYPGQASLVIDAGTCVTYDFADATGNYYGGSISPGLEMRFKALNYYTGALPLVAGDKYFKGNYGTDTQTAILSGVQNGLWFEIKGVIESYINQNRQMNIILTGGNSYFFDTLLKNSIFAPYVKFEPHLVLKGLNAVIQHYND